MSYSYDYPESSFGDGIMRLLVILVIVGIVGFAGFNCYSCSTTEPVLAYKGTVVDTSCRAYRRGKHGIGSECRVAFQDGRRANVCMAVLEGDVLCEYKCPGKLDCMRTGWRYCE